MPDLDHLCGSPLQLSATGGIQLASGPLQGQQKIIRRLLTSNNDLLHDLNYGAGIPKMIGSPGVESEITAIIRLQLKLEPIVIQYPPPKIGIYSDPDSGLYIATIQYVDNVTLETSQVQIPLSGITLGN